MSIDANQYEKAAQKQSYLRRQPTAFDVWINVLTGGSPNETISTRMWRWAHNEEPQPSAVKRTVGKAMDWWLNKIQPTHGLKAAAGDLGRSEAEEVRDRKTLSDAGAENVK